MIVKFNKKQIKALSSIHSKAEALFDELKADKPHLYRDANRSVTVRCFELGLIDYLISHGEISVED